MQANGPEEVIRAQRFEVVDAHGTVRARFGMMPDGSVGLAIAAADGTDRGWIGMREESGVPEVSLFDERGALRLHLGEDPTGAWVIQLSQDGRPRAKLMMEPGGSPALGLVDASGEMRSFIGLDAESGSPILTMYASDNRPRVTLAVDPTGGAIIATRGKGESGSALRAGEFEAAAFEIFDDRGDAIWKAP